VIVKPMSPAYIRERAMARLALPAKYKRVPANKSSLAQRVEAYVETIIPANDQPNNVVQLFEHATSEPNPELV